MTNDNQLKTPNQIQVKKARRKLGAIDDLIADQVATISRDVIEQIAVKTVDSLIPRSINVMHYDRLVATIDRQHYLFDLALKVIGAKVPLFLVGSAATGKTTLAKNISKALDLPFVLYQCHRDLGAYEIEGFISPIDRQFCAPRLYEAYKNGGVILFDEIANCSGSGAMVLNALLANDFFTFANGETVEKHANCILIAGDNTTGTGATEQYGSRSRLDASTIDRFAYLEIPIDRGLEFAACGIHDRESEQIEFGEKIPTIEQWIDCVQGFRTWLVETGLRQVLITPRASILGSRLIPCGIGFDSLSDMLLLRHLNPEQKSKAKQYLASHRSLIA